MDYFRNRLRFRKRFAQTAHIGSAPSVSTQGSSSLYNNPNAYDEKGCNGNSRTHGGGICGACPSELSGSRFACDHASRSIVALYPEDAPLRHEPAARLVEAVPTAINGAHHTAVTGQSSNVTTTYGPVQTVNNCNSVINHVATYGPNGLDTIQARITAFLQTHHVPQAVYDAQPDPGCMSGPNVEVLRDIISWIKDGSGPPILWVKGQAMSGKTEIAWNVCVRTAEAPQMILGGSFFCSPSADSAAQHDVRRVIPTLAQLLARQSADFSQALANELVCDPDILHKQFATQARQLLQKPLLSLKETRIPVVFVVDALDQFGTQLTGEGKQESHKMTTRLLRALIELARSVYRLPVKLLVTSRPNAYIRSTFLAAAASSKVLQLDKQQNLTDSRLYTPTILQGAMLLLKTLSVGGLPLTTLSVRLPGLCKFEYRQFEELYSYTQNAVAVTPMGDLCDILQRTPDIEDLRVEYSSFGISDEDFISHAGNRVVLPRLKSLTIGHVDAGFTSALMESIDAPKLDKLIVRFNPVWNHQDAFCVPPHQAGKLRTLVLDGILMADDSHARRLEQLLSATKVLEALTIRTPTMISPHQAAVPQFFTALGKSTLAGEWLCPEMTEFTISHCNLVTGHELLSLVRAREQSLAVRAIEFLGIKECAGFDKTLISELERHVSDVLYLPPQRYTSHDTMASRQDDGSIHL